MSEPEVEPTEPDGSTDDNEGIEGEDDSSAASSVGRDAE